jgi:hypothetical protein
VFEGVRWGLPFPLRAKTTQTVYMDVGVNAGELCAVILCWRRRRGRGLFVFQWYYRELED